MVSSKSKKIMGVGVGALALGGLLLIPTGDDGKNALGGSTGGGIIGFVKTKDGSDSSTITTTTTTSPDGILDISSLSNIPLADTSTKKSSKVNLPSGSSILNSDGSQTYADNFMGPIPQGSTRANFHSTPTGSSYNKDFVGPLNKGDSITGTKKEANQSLINPITLGLPKDNSKPLSRWFK